MSGLGILWRDSAAERFEAPVFEGERQADLAILGGGFTGCAAALEAAGQGADTVLLEALDVGHGGSGRNVGLVNAGLWLPPDRVCAELGPEAGERLNAALAAAPALVYDLIAAHGIACEPVRAGTLHLAHARGALPQLAARHAQMAARGAPVRLLDAGETAARTGTAAFHGALLDARAGTVQPLSYARGLARAAAAQGARIHEHSPAESAEFHGGRWIIRTARGRLAARALLVATNAYHRPLRQVPLPRVPVVQFFQLATAPLGHNLMRDILPGGEGCWDTALVMSSVRRDAAGRVIIGGMGGESAVHRGWAQRKLARLFPRLAEAEIAHAWAGRIAMTSDHLPRILRIGPRDAYAVFGYSGRGIGPGTVFGQAAARALLGGDEGQLPVAPVPRHGEVLPALRTAFYEAGARAAHALNAWR